MAIPTIVASSGPFSTATTALTVTLPTHAAGDRIWIAAAGPVATVSAPSGWTEDPNLFLSGSGTQTNVFYLDATSSSETNPVFVAPVNHLIAVAVTIRGGGAVDGYVTATPTPAISANLTGPNITTTAADTLLLAFIGSGFDSASNPITTLVSWGAATATSVTRQGGTTSGNGSQVCIIKGESATAQTITGLDAARHTATSGRYNVGVVALKAASGGTVHAGAMSVAGSGSLTPAPNLSAVGATVFAGLATQAAIASLSQPAALAPSGAGILTPAGSLSQPGAWAASGSGAVSAAARRQQPGALGTAGAGNVTVAPALQANASVSATASSPSTAFSASVVFGGAAVLAGGSAFSATGDAPTPPSDGGSTLLLERRRRRCAVR